MGDAFEEAYKMTINEETMGDQVGSAFNQMMSEIQKTLRGRLFSIRLDLGKRLTRNILGVNIQYCDANFNTVVKSLALIEIHGSATSARLEESVREVFNKNHFSTDQLYSITTAEMPMDSSQLSQFEDEDINPFPQHRIRCLAQVIQLVAKDFFRKRQYRRTQYQNFVLIKV